MGGQQWRHFKHAARSGCSAGASLSHGAEPLPNHVPMHRCKSANNVFGRDFSPSASESTISGEASLSTPPHRKQQECNGLAFASEMSVKKVESGLLSQWPTLLFGPAAISAARRAASVRTGRLFGWAVPFDQRQPVCSNTTTKSQQQVRKPSCRTIKTLQFTPLKASLRLPIFPMLQLESH